MFYYVGNKVKYGEKLVSIVSVSASGFYEVLDELGNSDIATEGELQPIPLEEKDLEDLGFTFAPVTDSSSSCWTGWWKRGGLELGVVDTTGAQVRFPVYAYLSDKTIKLEWYHQLQNLLKVSENL